MASSFHKKAWNPVVVCLRLRPTLSTPVKQASLVFHVPVVLFPSLPLLLILIPPFLSCTAVVLRSSYSFVYLSQPTFGKGPKKSVCIRI